MNKSNNGINTILLILLILEIILGEAYVLGFKKGMEECRQIYMEVNNGKEY